LTDLATELVVDVPLGSDEVIEDADEDVAEDLAVVVVVLRVETDE
jgi:hypothetical protein